MFIAMQARIPRVGVAREDDMVCELALRGSSAGSRRAGGTAGVQYMLKKGTSRVCKLGMLFKYFVAPF
jgi:hypothetical protein